MRIHCDIICYSFFGTSLFLSFFSYFTKLSYSFGCHKYVFEFCLPWYQRRPLWSRYEALSIYEKIDVLISMQSILENVIYKKSLCRSSIFSSPQIFTPHTNRVETKHTMSTAQHGWYERDNYRGIALLNIAYTMISNVLYIRLLLYMYIVHAEKIAGEN